MTRHLIILVCLLLATSCSKKIYVPVEVQKEVPIEVPVTHDVYHTNTVVDSIWMTDTVRIYERGDTVFNERIAYRNRWMMLHDTVRVTDSIPKIVTVEIPKPYPVTEIQEVNVLHWHQKALMLVGGAALIALALWIAYRFRKR